MKLFQITYSSNDNEERRAAENEIEHASMNDPNFL